MQVSSEVHIKVKFHKIIISQMILYHLDLGTPVSFILFIVSLVKLSGACQFATGVYFKVRCNDKM